MGSSCSTLPRLCPACKTRIWHRMPGSNCCLEVLCTSRNLVYPENSLGSSCRTVPRLCPRRKRGTWHCMPGSKLVVQLAQYSRLEPASTGESRRGGAPRRGVVWFSHRRLFSSKCGRYGLVGSVPCRLLSLSLSGRGGSTASLRFVMPKGRPAPPISSIFHLFGLRLAISISHATTHVKSRISHGQKYREISPSL